MLRPANENISFPSLKTISFPYLITVVKISNCVYVVRVDILSLFLL